MSLSSERSQVRLDVRTQDPATEIFVIDGQFSLAARGIGALQTSLDPGIYTVKVRAGNDVREEHVLLREGEGEVLKVFSPMAFSSAAPLVSTAYSHEFHRDAAERVAQAPPRVTAGQGSQIFVLSRDFTSRDRPKHPQTSYPDPARGLTLRDVSGAIIANLQGQSEHDLSWDPWAACNVGVSPGVYRLCLDLPTGDRLEQNIVASAGWQTRIYLLQRAYGEGPDDRRADLAGASILLARPGGGSGRNESQDRLTELARLGLTERRTILSADVLEMLKRKFEDPMLGLFGGHLLLLEKEPDLNLLGIVVNNLRGLLDVHPDVEALALRLPQQKYSYIFHAPPMLRVSWALVLAATVNRPELVPRDSVAATIASQIWAEDPWLIWTSPNPSNAFNGGTSRPSVRRVERKNVARVGEVLAQMTESPTGRPSLRGRRRPPRGVASSFQFGPEGADSKSGSAPLDDDSIRRLVRTLGLPRTTVEDLVAKARARA